MVSFIPMLSAFIAMQLDRLHVPLRSRNLKRSRYDLYYFYPRTWHKSVPETYLMMDVLYGWSYATHRSWTRLLDKVVTLPAALQFSPLDSVVSVDNEYKPAIQYACSIATDIWIALVFSPLFEEVLKTSIFGLVLVVLCESWFKYVEFGHRPVAICVLFHCVTFLFPLSFRLVVHYIWNFVICYFSTNGFTAEPG
jgi:hypothetical protein